MSIKREMRTPGEVLLDAGLGKDALPFLLADHEAEPHRWEHITNLGAAYRIIGDFGKSRGCYLQAMDMKPDSHELWHNYAHLLEDEGLFDESKRAALKAFKLRPHPQTAMGLATSYLREGNWREGAGLWMYARLNQSWRPIVGLQPWAGEPIDGKNMLVLLEGGYGDVFMTLQFMREMKEAGAQVTLVVWDEMVELMKMCWFIDRVIPKSDRFDASGFHYQVPVLSLPFLLHESPKTLRPMTRVLEPPEPNVRAARQALANGARKKIGLCWWAEESQIARKFRTIPVEELLPLKALDCRWINLTMENAPEWVETKPLNSWSDTAAIISQLDGVVTVDTAVAHLAGDLGIPTLIVVPLNSDWKWGLGNERTWWYESAQLVRNTDVASFTPAIEMAAKKVKEWLHTDNSTAS